KSVRNPSRRPQIVGTRRASFMTRARARLALGLVAPLALGTVATVRAAVVVEGEGDPVKVTFRYTPVIAVKKVVVAGSWNNWAKPYTPLKANATGAYEVTLDLRRGRYAYKFVIDEDNWQQDKENPRSEPDGQSGLNSVLDLGAPRAAVEGKEGDGAVSAQDLSHDPTSLAQACALDGKRRLVLRMQTLAHDVESVVVDAVPRPEAASEKADADGF